MPRETHLSFESGNPSCCRFCGLHKDVTKKTLKKENEELLHAAAEAVYGRSLPWKEIISLV